MLQEDKDILEGLKAKYKNRAAADPHVVTPANSGQLPSSVQGQDSCGLAHVILCQVCQGSGIQTDVYEYRRLESTCTHCKGEGVFYLTGTKSCSNNTGVQEQQQAPSSSDTLVMGSRARVKQAKIDKLQERINVLVKEEADLRSELDNDSSSPQKQALQSDLLQHLQCHLQTLRQQHSKMAAPLGKV